MPLLETVRAANANQGTIYIKPMSGNANYAKRQGGCLRQIFPRQTNRTLIASGSACIPASRSSTATLLLDMVSGRLDGASELGRVNGAKTKNVEMVDCLFLGKYLYYRCRAEVDEQRWTAGLKTRGR